MNKELIKKYKTEFNHYINEGKLLCYTEIGGPYYDVSDETWDSICDIGIIINDDYVEFRKAIIDGKQVQFKNSTEWKDIAFLTVRPEETPDMYRIKPELTIRVGDWLFDLQYKTYHRINKVLSDKVELNGFNVLLLAINDHNYKLWKPEIGEWCIIDETHPNHKNFIVQKWQADSTWTPAPYTGPLPYFIKG